MSTNGRIHRKGVPDTGPLTWTTTIDYASIDYEVLNRLLADIKETTSMNPYYTPADARRMAEDIQGDARTNLRLAIGKDEARDLFAVGTVIRWERRARTDVLGRRLAIKTRDDEWNYGGVFLSFSRLVERLKDDKVSNIQIATSWADL